MYVLGWGEVVVEFVEVESGKCVDCLDLVWVLVEVKWVGVVLFIVKLDCFVCNVVFIVNFLESGVEVMVVDMLEVNCFVLYIMVVVVE